jgi:2-polyprenyl-3-methyl-5-hydroxy-6-metoxy-1,4-benzoquinol methylase
MLDRGQLDHTSHRLFERYNTYLRRPTVADAETRKTVFRSFEATLADLLPASHSASVLDVACGEGSLLIFLRSRGYTELFGLDLSPENVEICHSLGLD